MTRPKYGNIKTNGYDSKSEARRAGELKLLERAGKIENLREQVRFEVIPQQKRDGKVIEQSAHYVADFAYTDTATEQEIVEDVKGVRTPAYILKRKLMLLVHGIRIREVS